MNNPIRFLFAAAMLALAGMASAQTDKMTNSNVNWPDDCAKCGVVTNIEKVSDAKSGTGGAVIGAVAGGLLGNQVGGGTGKTVATVAGVAGGAYAGKKIAEGNKEYKITIRMRDGEIKHAHQETLNSIKVGSMVRLKDGKAKLYK
ncbi:glycine zipper 2TM domain-containing protein [Arenimonas sp.]|jgi:outer membrane lipoprotein SlyB|uniref:glycine zipper 2TM domain-containing protein n=1 Tax=Arenimonas sp. TaxID=1872635 RepID=UPI0037BEB57B